MARGWEWEGMVDLEAVNMAPRAVMDVLHKWVDGGGPRERAAQK